MARARARRTALPSKPAAPQPPLPLPRPLAFALAGGGSLGAVQIGQLHALRDAGVRADLVVGTSVGALNGAAYAQDPDGLSDLEAVWTSLRRDDVFAPARRGRRRVGRAPAYDDSGLRELICRSLRAERFEELALPLTVVATDAATRRVVLIDSGDLAPALRASAAIPGAFPAVHHAGRRLVDGGVVAPIPVREALGLGAAAVVALRTNADVDVWPHPARTTPWRVGLRVVGTALARRRAARIRRLAGDAPVLLLPAPRLDRVSAFDFADTDRLIAYGYETTASLLRRLTSPKDAVPRRA